MSERELSSSPITPPVEKSDDTSVNNDGSRKKCECNFDHEKLVAEFNRLKEEVKAMKSEHEENVHRTLLLQKFMEWNEEQVARLVRAVDNLEVAVNRAAVAETSDRTDSAGSVSDESDAESLHHFDGESTR